MSLYLQPVSKKRRQFIDKIGRQKVQASTEFCNKNSSETLIFLKNHFNNEYQVQTVDINFFIQ